MKSFTGLRNLIGAILTGWIMMSCQVQVKTFHDKNADFSKYKTFCWMTGCEFKFTGPSYLDDSLLRENLKVAIVDELRRKGLTQDNNNPDLLVGFTITVKDEQAIIYHRSEDTPVYYKPIDTEEESVTYLKGTLIMAMAERASSQLVWESEAVSYMELNPDFSEKNIRKGIKLVLKNYPPKKE